GLRSGDIETWAAALAAKHGDVTQDRPAPAVTSAIAEKAAKVRARAGAGQQTLTDAQRAAAIDQGREPGVD
ncbi:MAG: hypothetical protein ACM3O6_13235, partial [Acidobacteriota bacterium]